MKISFTILCAICLLISCSDKKASSNTTPLPPTVTTQPSSLENALACFGQSQNHPESLYLAILDVAQYLPDLQVSELLELYEHMTQQRYLNRGALGLLVQRLTRLDPAKARTLVKGMKELRDTEIGYLNTLILLTESEHDHTTIVKHFTTHAKAISRYRLGPLDGADMATHFWSFYYKSLPELNQSEDLINELGTYDAYAFAEIRREENPDNPFYLEYLSEAKQQYQKLPDDHKNHIIFTRSTGEVNLLQLDRLSNLTEKEYEAILNITVHPRRYGDYIALSTVCSHYYSMLQPLKAYEKLNQPLPYKDTHLTAIPLIHLIKLDCDMAIREFAKLADWPAIIPVPLYRLTAKDRSFTFFSQLAYHHPQQALSAGGKHLIYPEFNISTTLPIIGVSYGLSLAEKEEQLVQTLLDAPRDWDKGKMKFYDKAEDTLEGIAMHSMEKWHQYAPSLAKKYDLDLSRSSFRYARPQEIIDYYLTEKSIKDPLTEIKYYLEWIHKDNPILAQQLAEKQNIILELTPFD